MVLRLHVWGPAFGLASIDAECLATITYLAYAVPTNEWELVATSPSAVPTHALPSLEDTDCKTWTAGFRPITAHLSTLNPAYNLDRNLTPSQQADSTAYTAHLSATALPLLALSLYVSSANWAAVTRPAYSTLLPLPLPWTEPVLIRRRMSALAAHLGLDDLNIDAATEQRDDANPNGFLRLPERLRPRATAASVRAALAPEQTALFRLEAAAADCLAPLADLLKAQRARRFFFFSGASGNDSVPTSLDCLAFGYLALMTVPVVPRAWLRDVLRAPRYDGLCVFVDAVRDEVFGGDVGAALPWAADEKNDAPWTLTRFVGGVVEATVPERWTYGEEEQQGGGGMLAALLSTVAGLGLVGGAVLYRHLSPFGTQIHHWQVPRSYLDNLLQLGVPSFGRGL